MLLVRLMTVVLILAGGWVGFNALTEIGRNPVGFVTAAALALGAWFAAALLIALACIYDRLGDMLHASLPVGDVAQPAIPPNASMEERLEGWIRGQR